MLTQENLFTAVYVHDTEDAAECCCSICQQVYPAGVMMKAFCTNCGRRMTGSYYKDIDHFEPFVILDELEEDK